MVDFKSLYQCLHISYKFYRVSKIIISALYRLKRIRNKIVLKRSLIIKHKDLRKSIIMFGLVVMHNYVFFSFFLGGGRFGRGSIFISSKYFFIFSFKG